MARTKSADIPDAQLVRLNSLGYSLAAIAEVFKCHPSTVTNRLKDLGVAPADTRRSFMEDVLRTMTPDQVEWLSSYLGPHYQVKNFVIDIIKTAYMARNEPQ